MATAVAEAEGASDRSCSDRGSIQQAEAEAGSREHPPSPASDSSDESHLAGAQEVDEELAEGLERVILLPAQLSELLETRFHTCVAEAVPKLVKGMVITLTERLTEQVSALRMSTWR